MTPTELVTAIRNRYNAVGDTFWSDSEILDLVWGACTEMAREAQVIERVYTTTTVAGTQQYAFPTNTIAIKRVTYNGQKLQPISFREDDQLTGLNQSLTTQSTPQYYFVFNEVLYLRPLPDSAVTLEIYSFNAPQEITTTSTLEIPTQYHIDCIDYALSVMHAKEKNFEGAQYYRGEWEKKLARIKNWQRQRLRSDANAAVVNIDTMNESFLGTV